MQLPDEYDQISEDLEPFWGLDPKELQRIEAVYEANYDICVMEKADGVDLHIARMGGKNTTTIEDKDIPQSARALLEFVWIDHVSQALEVALSSQESEKGAAAKAAPASKVQPEMTAA